MRATCTCSAESEDVFHLCCSGVLRTGTFLTVGGMMIRGGEGGGLYGGWIVGEWERGWFVVPDTR